MSDGTIMVNEHSEPIFTIFWIFASSEAYCITSCLMRDQALKNPIGTHFQGDEQERHVLPHERQAMVPSVPVLNDFGRASNP